MCRSGLKRWERTALTGGVILGTRADTFLMVTRKREREGAEVGIYRCGGGSERVGFWWALLPSWSSAGRLTTKTGRAIEAFSWGEEPAVKPDAVRKGMLCDTVSLKKIYYHSNRKMGEWAVQGSREGLWSSNKSPDGIGDHEFIVAPSAGCVVFPAVLNSCAISVEKINSWVSKPRLGFGQKKRMH